MLFIRQAEGRLEAFESNLFEYGLNDGESFAHPQQPPASFRVATGLWDEVPLEQGMDFWTAYASQCLQSPWMILPETSMRTLNVPTQKVFVHGGELSDDQAAMLSKMVAALKYSPEHVTFLSESQLTALAEVSKKLQIVFFGQHLPGRFGEAFHWSSHQVVQTHDLQSLLDQPELKKETWSHLKMFASLK